MSRLIDADALSRIVKLAWETSDSEDFEKSVFIAIATAPTIEERKKGKWIIRDNPGTGWYRVTCSECGEDVTSTVPCIGFFPNAKVIWDFCPNCGSYNGGET